MHILFISIIFEAKKVILPNMILYQAKHGAHGDQGEPVQTEEEPFGGDVDQQEEVLDGVQQPPATATAPTSTRSQPPLPGPSALASAELYRHRPIGPPGANLVDLLKQQERDKQKPLRLQSNVAD